MVGIVRKSKFRFIQSFWTCETLLYFLAHPEGVKKSEFRAQLKVAAITESKLQNLLMEEGIIQLKTDPKHVTFELTEKGWLLAQKIEEMNQILTKFEK